MDQKTYLPFFAEVLALPFGRRAHALHRLLKFHGCRCQCQVKECAACAVTSYAENGQPWLQCFCPCLWQELILGSASDNFSQRWQLTQHHMEEPSRMSASKKLLCVAASAVLSAGAA